jgi:type IV secretory pathway VirB10-like protein
MITNTTTIFRMNFEAYPELRNDIRLKVAKKIFDKMSDEEKEGLKKSEWAKAKVDEWDTVEEDYIPEDYAELVRMTDKKKDKTIEIYQNMLSKKARVAEEKEAAKQAKEAEKEAAKQAKVAEKEAAKQAKKAEKEAAKEAAKEAKKAEKEQAKKEKKFALLKEKVAEVDPNAVVTPDGIVITHEIKAANGVMLPFGIDAKEYIKKIKKEQKK